MKQEWKEHAKKALSNMAGDMLENTICIFVWGEPEVPECLRRELEKKEEDME